MMNLTVLAKASHGGQLKQVGEILRNQFEGLDAEVKVTGNPVTKWIQVSVSGEDEAVAAAYIRKEIGICPVSLENVGNGAILKGYISKVDSDGLIIDIGVFDPKITQAVLPLAVLQEGLAGGKDVAIKKIAEAYALSEGLPLIVKVTSKEAEDLQVALSAEQVEKFQSWQQSLLDRLIILRVSKDLVSSTLERTRLYRDVINIETLGLFEYALTCKLGTDATGLIPRVGRYMRYAVFQVFNAEKAMYFLREQGLTL